MAEELTEEIIDMSEDYVDGLFSAQKMSEEKKKEILYKLDSLEHYMLKHIEETDAYIVELKNK